jgi:hypothetical protein
MATLCELSQRTITEQCFFTMRGFYAFWKMFEFMNFVQWSDPHLIALIGGGAKKHGK